MTTPKTLKIDFVSDVACPWCAVGLASLETALKRLDGQVRADLRFQPFELNPDMGPQGQDVSEHLTQKYGSTEQQQAAIRERIRQRGEEVGFTFRKEGRGRIWNTFDAHRLLHWAGLQGEGAQRRLKMELLKAYHGQALNVTDPAVLADAAQAAGLHRDEALAVLREGRYEQDVRDAEAYYTQQGIHSVPSVIINDQYLIQGGQPADMFEEVLREIARKEESQDA